MLLGHAAAGRLHGWEWWRSVGAPRTVCAPMVDQSELPFRLLCRELGTDLCYTPMLHARLFTEVGAYREQHFDPAPADEPLVAQLAGHDPPTVLRAAQMVEANVAAVDLNFGCPQGIARKGRYGAFLLDEPDVMVALVRTLATELSVPVTAKLRLLPSASDGRAPSVDASVALCQRLAEAGASALAVHGRTREQNKQYCGRADWDAIARVVQAVDVPVIANGGIGSRADVDACLAHTGAAAVMSSEALLENPALFCANRDPTTGDYLDQDALARRDRTSCAAHPPCKGAAMVRGHLFKLLHNGLREHVDLRDELLVARSLDGMRAVVDRLAERRWHQPAFHTDGHRPDLSWYGRHQSVAVEAADGDAAAGADGSDGGGAAAVAAARATEPSAEEVAKTALARRERKAMERKRRNRNRGQGTRAERRAANRGAGAFMSGAP